MLNNAFDEFGVPIRGTRDNGCVTCCWSNCEGHNRSERGVDYCKHESEAKRGHERIFFDAITRSHTTVEESIMQFVN